LDKNILLIEIEHEISGELNDYEIMRLLTPINPPKFYFIIKKIQKIKAFFKYLCEWKLVISINNIEYRIGLNKFEKIKHIYKDLSLEEEYQIFRKIHDINEAKIYPIEEKQRQIDEIISEIHKKEIL